MKVARVLVGLLAAMLIIVGAGVAIALGPDDTWRGDAAAVPGGQPVVSTAPGLLNVAGVELAVTGVLEEGEVFIGASHPVHVENYLADVRRTRITTLGADGIDGTDTAAGSRTHPSVPPAQLDVWTNRARGEGEQQMSVPLTDAAAVEVVVMPAAAAKVVPRVGIGYALPGAFVGGVVVAVVGLVLFVGVLLLGRRSRRARGSDAVAQRSAPVGTPPSSAATVRRAVTVGAVALVATGCSIPHQVDHGEAPGVVPLTDEDAQAVLDDYDERNNAAIKKSYTGDGSLWGTADTGPHLAVDQLVARIADVEGREGEPGVGDHEAGRVYSTEQHTYPLRSMIVTETTWDGEEADPPELDLFVKENVTSAWKGSSSVPVAKGDLPTALPADEATPDAADLERAAEVDLLLQTWMEKGEVSDLSVPDDLADLRREAATAGKGVEDVQYSSGTWGGGDDPTGPGGSVHVARVEEGLLLLTDQEWEIRNYLKPGFEWTQTKEGAAIYGTQHKDNVHTTKHVLTAAVLVPDSGDAEVLGSELRRVIDFPRG